jgi:hypothetical protein
MALRLGVIGPFSGNPGRWICRETPFFKMTLNSMIDILQPANLWM